MILPNYVLTAIEKLKSSGFEAYVVGGAVRSFVLGQPIADYDITTSATPEEMLEVFADYCTFAPGIKHGTVCVLIDGVVCEITAYRTESDYTDCRHPGNVEFVRNLKEDLSRRDFTVNAMCSNGKEIIDVFGGIADCGKRIIRCIGDPEVRFKEDALRILRAVRFCSALGFSMEENTKAALFAQKQLLLNISAERIREEFNKILLGKNCLNVLLEYRDIIAVFIPEIIKCFDFRQHSKYHQFDVYTHCVRATAFSGGDLELRLAAFLHDIGKPDCFFTDEMGEGHFYGHPKRSYAIAECVLKRLKYPKTQIKHVLTLIEYHDYAAIPKGAEIYAEKYVLRLMNKIGENVFEKLLRLKRADNAAKKIGENPVPADVILSEQAFEGIRKQRKCFSLDNLAVNGDDIIALGIKGKAVGDTLNFLLDSVISGTENDRGTLLEIAEKFAKNI